MATKTKAKVAFSVPCPNCGTLADEDGDGGLHVRLADLAVKCEGCDQVVTRADLVNLINDARRLLAWLDASETIAAGDE